MTANMTCSDLFAEDICSRPWNELSRDHPASVREIKQVLEAYASHETAYWESRAKTAELKVLTFHEQVASLTKERAELRLEANAAYDKADDWRDLHDVAIGEQIKTLVRVESLEKALREMLVLTNWPECLVIARKALESEGK